VESCLENGTAVEAGAVLIQFQKEQLEQRKKELEIAWKQAELQLAQAKLDQTEAAWIPAEDEAQTALNQAQKEYNEAAAALSQSPSRRMMRQLQPAGISQNQSARVRRWMGHSQMESQ